MRLSEQQNKIAISRGKVFLEGKAGTGKTSVGVARLADLLAQGVPASSILVIVPQRTLAFPYYEVLNQPDLAAGGQVVVSTLGGIARRMVDIFFPLVAQDAGFTHAEGRPTFLSLETAQYFMARLITPIIETEGYFDTVTIDRNRLYSQLIDNLNKAAVVGFDYREVGEMLKNAWTGDDTQRRMYDDMQNSIIRFREYCLEHNLLDFSLQVEVFMKHLWKLENVRTYLFGQYRHLIIDNIEEDTPAAHEVMADLIAESDSALVIYDSDAGYRRFLGADPAHAYFLKSTCETHATLETSYVTTPDLEAMSKHIAVSLYRAGADDVKDLQGDPRAPLIFDSHRYYPQMIDWVAEQIKSLVDDYGVPPKEIVVMSPFLSDALRFSLMNRLQTLNIPVRSHRPSRSLREEPAAVALLTFSQLAHPDWQLRPTVFDFIYALMEAIDGLDLIRAQLLGGNVLKTRDNRPTLLRFDQLSPDIQARITFEFGNRYDRLRDWLETYITASQDDTPDELDHFWSRLFGEVLSQEGFGYHDDFDAAEIAANLIDSARKFRQIIGDSNAPAPEGKTLAQEYVEMVAQGIIADQYLRQWEVTDEENAVLLAPAYTFLMSNRPVDYQFWLNVGGRGWAERLYQPLTNPYVLTLEWQAFDDRKWTDMDEVEVANDSLYRLSLGLIRRCRKNIYLGFSELGEQGYEQRGAMLDAIQRMLRRTAE
ncbi:MAG: hypothetical protein RLP44_32745 [Aggregatilineales bacterium]